MRRGERWRRSSRGAPGSCSRCARRGGRQFDGPVLELMTALRARVDQRLAGARARRARRVVRRRTRAAAAARRTIRRGRSATRCSTSARRRHREHLEGGGVLRRGRRSRAGRRRGERRRGARRSCASRASACATRRRDGLPARPRAVYGRAGQPCPRCGGRSGRAGRGRTNRTTYWCPACQRDHRGRASRLRRVGHKGADLIVPGNTLRELRRGARGRRRHDRVRRPVRAARRWRAPAAGARPGAPCARRRR